MSDSANGKADLVKTLTKPIGKEARRTSCLWMRRVQIIDRRGNRYVKRVEDPETGEVVRNVDEPLTEHRGYGSAKRT